MHYQRWRKYGDPTILLPVIQKGCAVEGCANKHYIKSYCNRHHRRWRVHGNPLAVWGERHGLSNDPLYGQWANIKDRCFNPRCNFYPHYGGRGISMHGPWQNSFTKFHTDLIAEIGPRSSKEYSLDRINNNGDYEPGNVRWATALQQANNTRWNHLLSANGRTQTLAQWSRERSINYETLRHRLLRGWTNEHALELDS